MTTNELRQLIKHGETSQVQFKEMFSTAIKIADEMIAFANSRGGCILFGIKDKTSEIADLSYEQIQEISREVGNIANEQIRPTIYIQTEVVEIDGKMVLVVHVPEGKDAPYKNLSGNIWIKQGADKRRVTDNAEILSLFQKSGSYHPDEAGVNGSSYKDIDTLALDRFFENLYRKPISEFDIPKEQVLQSLHIMDDQGRLTAAGALFFGRRPQQFFPVFVIKAVWFYGNTIAGTQYRDSRDIEGTIPEMYEQGLRWLQSCLRRTQNGQSFNSIGKLEIPEPVLEELLQNALVHLDLLKTAAIRLLVFDDRVEIINPGSVMGGHTVEEVMLGNSFPRNPLMANFCAKTMPYRGLGSGIPRVLREDCDVQFIDSKDGNQFTAVIKRPIAENAEETQEQASDISVESTEKTIQKTTQKTTRKTTQKTTQKILELIKQDNTITKVRLAELCGISYDGIKWQINNMQTKGLLRRIGPDKGGHWEIIE